MRALGVCLGLLALLAPPFRAARADDRPPRRIGLHSTEGKLGVSVGLQDLFQPTDGDRLRSGFASSVLIWAELYRDGDTRPVAREARRTYVVYDIWDERFRVRTIDARGPREREVPGVREAIDEATALVRFPVAPLERLAPGATYRVRFRADLNPLSEEVKQDVRRWLVRPPAQGRGSAGDSFFGSFVSIFVNPKIEESERRLTFYSQPFIARPTREAAR